jgi:Tol biopolymer transport system component
LPGVSSFPRYDAAGHLLFARAGSLLAQPFDVNNLQLSGEPRVVADNVADSVGGFSVSANGVLAYRAGTRLSDSPLVRFDRSGQQLRSESLTGSLQAPNLSREGNRLAIERTDASNTDVWIIDLVRGTNTRITDDPAADIRPVFSPDGTRVAFTRQGAIYLKSSSGTGTEERLVSGEATDWSPDGKVISLIGGGDLWTVSLDGDRKPVPLVETKGNDRRGRFSPDGKWIAYETDVNGRLEIYVQRFPPTPERVQVSANGGSSAYWRRDGKELFFTSSDQTIMAVDVTLGSSFQAGTPRKLFDVPGVINNRRFVVTPDGQQILVPVQKAETAPITVVLNWATTRGP